MQNLSALVCCLVVALSSVSALAGAKTVVCWGDSITEGMAMKRNETYPARLQSRLGDGFRVLNSGDGGEDVVTIPARQGCLALQTSAQLVFDDGVRKIPIGDAADNGLRTPAGEKIKLTQALGREISVNPVAVGDGAYRLSFTEFGWNTAERPISYRLWLERADGRGRVVIPAGAPVVFASTAAVRDAFCEIVLMGANGGWQNQIENLIARYRQMFARRGRDKPHLAIVPFWSGITAAQAKAFKTAFGEQAVDFRSEAIRRGLAAEGLVATEQDRAEMAAGRVPPSLLYGNRPNCHLNAKGYDFLAQLLFERGRALKYW